MSRTNERTHEIFNGVILSLPVWFIWMSSITRFGEVNITLIFAGLIVLGLAGYFFVGDE